eukprot:EG_transcript_5035
MQGLQPLTVTQMLDYLLGHNGFAGRFLPHHLASLRRYGAALAEACETLNALHLGRRPKTLAAAILVVSMQGLADQACAMRNRRKVLQEDLRLVATVTGTAELHLRQRMAEVKGTLFKIAKATLACGAFLRRPQDLDRLLPYVLEQLPRLLPIYRSTTRLPRQLERCQPHEEQQLSRSNPLCSVPAVRAIGPPGCHLIVDTGPPSWARWLAHQRVTALAVAHLLCTALPTPSAGPAAPGPVGEPVAPDLLRLHQLLRDAALGPGCTPLGPQQASDDSLYACETESLPPLEERELREELRRGGDLSALMAMPVEWPTESSPKVPPPTRLNLDKLQYAAPMQCSPDVNPWEWGTLLSEMDVEMPEAIEVVYAHPPPGPIVADSTLSVDSRPVDVHPLQEEAPAPAAAPAPPPALPLPAAPVADDAYDALLQALAQPCEDEMDQLDCLPPGLAAGRGLYSIV